MAPRRDQLKRSRVIRTKSTTYVLENFPLAVEHPCRVLYDPGRKTEDAVIVYYVHNTNRVRH